MPTPEVRPAAPRAVKPLSTSRRVMPLPMESLLALVASPARLSYGPGGVDGAPPDSLTKGSKIPVTTGGVALSLDDITHRFGLSFAKTTSASAWRTDRPQEAEDS